MRASAHAGASAAPQRRTVRPARTGARALRRCWPGACCKEPVINAHHAIDHAPALLRQLFTPFFSTKKGGQGIGLMFVREVLSRHGVGFRRAAVDDMTRFEITLHDASPT